MKKAILTAFLITIASGPGYAASPAASPNTDVTDKVQNDLPGTHGGTTANPTAKSQDHSLSTTVEQEMPGIDKGSTANPTAKPEDSSLSTKETQDLAKAAKRN